MFLRNYSQLVIWNLQSQELIVQVVLVFDIWYILCIPLYYLEHVSDHADLQVLVLFIYLDYAGSPVVTIAGFAPQLVVITSKQRPRKLTIHGSDGEDYAFLLKGHEDLRQDERVMQVCNWLGTLVP